MITEEPTSPPERRVLATDALRSVLNALPALIVTTNPDGSIEDVSDSYMAYTGLSLKEAQEWAAHQMIHADDFDRAMEIWTHAIETGTPMQNEMRLRRADGVYRWHLVQGVPVRDALGQIERWITVSVDIDERKQAEARERFLAEFTLDMISELTSDEVLVHVARLAVPTLADICAIGVFDDGPHTPQLEVAGVLPEEAPYVARIFLRGWRVAPGEKRLIGEAIAAREAVFMPDVDDAWIEACAPDEEQVEHAKAVAPASLICVPLLARGAAIGIATFGMTRSKRRYREQDLLLIKEVIGRASVVAENAALYRNLVKTAADLAHANSAKDEFLGLVSHELKTPITVIYGNAHILQRQGREMGESQWQAAVGDVLRESQRLHGIIDNLLALARSQHVDLEPVMLTHLAERMATEHRRDHPMRKIEVTSDTDAFVLAGAVYVEQVLKNLISNAEKYSQWDRRIELVLHRNAEEVEVHVLDRGDGIAADDLERVFTPFYRGEKTSNRAGVGIGLAVCKRLIEAQGGRVWAHNREDGGADIGFALPVAEDSAA